MASAPTFAATPAIGMAKVNAADTVKDDPSTNVFTIITGGASGTRVDRVDIQLIGTTGTASTANVVRLFLDNSTNKRLFREQAITASTPSASAAGNAYTITFPNGLFLPSASWSIKATMHTRTDARDDHMVIAYGGDL
jgi:hypothetical protein